MSRNTDLSRCSIIIRAYNEEDHIGRLLTGIMEQNLKDVEIIVVDSGSTDATVAIAARFPTKIISIDPGEFTFGRSLNLGCQAARSEILVFASAHVYPSYPDWLVRLVEPFKDPKVGLVYGKQRGDGDTRYSEHQQFRRMYPNTSVIPQRHPLCNNANAAIRRSLWERNPYDESLSGLEDLAWATWLLSEGYYLAYEANAVVIHLHDESPRQVLNRYKREAIALAQIRPEESFGLWDLFRLTVTNILSDLRNAIQDRRIFGVIWSILWFRAMQYLGTYLGFRHAGPVTDAVIRAFYYPESEPQRQEEDSREVPMIDYSKVTQAMRKVKKDDRHV
jgi:glycosyltransferase involved in cell wall biosynthesis